MIWQLHIVSSRPWCLGGQAQPLSAQAQMVLVGGPTALYVSLVDCTQPSPDAGSLAVMYYHNVDMNSLPVCLE